MLAGALVLSFIQANQISLGSTPSNAKFAMSCHGLRRVSRTRMDYVTVDDVFPTSMILTRPVLILRLSPHPMPRIEVECRREDVARMSRLMACMSAF